MAAKTMAEFQAALRKKTEGGEQQSGGDNALFRFWNMKEKETSTIRFLEDADPENPMFWIERQTIRIPFHGVVGGENPTTNKVSVIVQCADMFEPKTCPITRAIASWWKTDKDKALVYWKKKSFLYQGFVVKSPVVEENVPENPIRRFVLGPKLHKIIEASLLDPEMADLPFDRMRGSDFRILKGRNGDFASYDTSSWSRNTRPLTEAENIAIEQHGLWDLKTFRGRKPDADEIAAIEAMFHASVMDEPFDSASFGKYYRPYEDKGGSGEGADDAVTQVASRPAPVRTPAADLEADVAQAEEAVSAPSPTLTTASKMSADDVMAKLRANRKS